MTSPLALLVALAAGSAAEENRPEPPAMAQTPAQPPRSGPAAPARPGDAAVAEELEAARRAGTREAYDLFLARHPDHPLAGRARIERERLRP